MAKTAERNCRNGCRAVYMGFIRCRYIYICREKWLQLRYVHAPTEVLSDQSRLNKQQSSAVIN